MKLGVLIPNGDTETTRRRLELAAQIGFQSCQVYCGDMTDAYAAMLQNRARELGLELTAMVLPMAGLHSYAYPEMYATLGLVPESLRAMRLEAFQKGARFAHEVGVRNVLSHVGYISDNPFDKTRMEIQYLLGHFLDELNARGQNMLLETGEMLPVTLVQFIDAVNRPNLWINFDPSNLTTGGRANACDALALLKPWVRGFHAKDGVRPCGKRPKGTETPLGEGDVDFETLIAILKATGYAGSVSLECEIAGLDEKHVWLAGLHYLRQLLQNAECR